jgi:hypothetical protein
LFVLVDERLPRPVAVIGQLHLECVLPLLEGVVGILDVFFHALYQIALLVDLPAQFLDAPIALLDLVLKDADAAFGVVRLAGHDRLCACCVHIMLVSAQAKTTRVSARFGGRIRPGAVLMPGKARRWHRREIQAAQTPAALRRSRLCDAGGTPSAARRASPRIVCRLT